MALQRVLQYPKKEQGEPTKWFNIIKTQLLAWNENKLVRGEFVTVLEHLNHSITYYNSLQNTPRAKRQGVKTNVLVHLNHSFDTLTSPTGVYVHLMANVVGQEERNAMGPEELGVEFDYDDLVRYQIPPIFIDYASLYDSLEADFRNDIHTSNLTDFKSNVPYDF
jgi:hypothetical protein